LEDIPMLKTIALSLTLAMTATICLPLQGGGPTCGAKAQNACCGSTCPHCGCRLVPVCHTYCTTNKVTEYKYCCACEDICIPGVTPLCNKCRSCETSGGCAGTGDTCNNGCQEGCGGRCLVREPHKLVKFPVTKEVPVKKCTVEWVCPHCDCQGNCTQRVAPSSPVPPSAPVLPAPPAAGK
jgi:hypothetical protein